MSCCLISIGSEPCFPHNTTVATDSCTCMWCAGPLPVDGTKPVIGEPSKRTRHRLLVDEKPQADSDDVAEEDNGKRWWSEDKELARRAEQDLQSHLKICDSHNTGWYYDHHSPELPCDHPDVDPYWKHGWNRPCWEDHPILEEAEGYWAVDTPKGGIYRMRPRP